MPDLMSEMERTVNKGLLEYAASQTLFCPKCETIMDCTRTVTFDIVKDGQIHQSTVVLCGACYDRLCAAMSTAQGYCLEDVVDGRTLFNLVETETKPKLPVEKAAFNSKTVEVGKTYAIHHSSGYIVPATILYKRTTNWLRSRNVTHYICRNERTGRDIEVKSAAKFRYELRKTQCGKWEKV
jgi:hypothetical protein